MNPFRAVPITAAACLALIAGCAGEKPSDQSASTAVQSAPFTVEDTAYLSTNAKVKSINYSSRHVMIVDAAGDSMEFTASEQVQRLNEVKVGDHIDVECMIRVRAEVRPPTAEEAADPVAAVGIAGRGVDTQTPVAGGARALRVVTTVTAIDQANMHVTLRGPMGDTTTIKAKNPDNVRRLKVGDTIILTYTEAMAVGVRKR